MTCQGIVVGVDGSPTSTAALHWAAMEAVRRDRELLVIHAFDQAAVGAPTPIGGTYAMAARDLAKALVAYAIAEARRHAPGVNVRGDAVLGSPARALVAASTEADMVVVGSRGRGGLGSLLLGSVGDWVASHAHATVAVVRGRDNARGPVVVGVDGSQESVEALGVGYEQAAGLGCGIVAIRIYPPPRLLRGRRGASPAEEPQERRAVEQQELDQDVAPWREKYPDVATECVVMEGRPTWILTGVSHNASRVVVGTRGHGGVAGLLAGSVSLRLLRRAECPVLVARPRR